MDRLVIISNRVAPVTEGKSQAGGLAVAILEALRRQGGIWFGWNGEMIEEEQTDPGPTITESEQITYATMPLKRRDLEEYYNGYANATLWPLLHYRLDLANFDNATYEGYRRVNALFADRLSPMLRDKDLVWVHDYHLIPLGSELRQRGCRQRIGFFLHTPWPSSEMWQALPAHAELVRALCAYDLVGFHTADDLNCFAQCVTNTGAGAVEVMEDGVSLRIVTPERVVTGRVFPISIDTAHLETLARQAARSSHTRRLRDSLVGRSLIIGVDRLDYSKGLPQRFNAFQELLERYPQNQSRVSFLQIAPPSRSDVTEYQQIRRELETMAGHINGHYAEFDWVPIRYLNKSFGRRTLAGFYRHARVGLVTPLRDGMNLVAKEYVACQNPEDPGVLVLSRFAGAAREMDGALIVNPYDTAEVAENLQRALHMGLEERLERHATMIAQLRRYDITRWREDFVAALEGGNAGNAGAESLPSIDFPRQFA
ncbi:alpha,alpha-trehalose-phosphate synthase (UDP-forming) [Niveispirillum irakense]|uniref:alpha,alpha-trehalose-phosphate synthase (UDP-forming) n=1 Tax=Niveispirillum irakense TaxID=34011 RepID=UPI00040C327B|nr:alpha,alpha-trehalose-phosphate synthase (UDP-forming) [Niveispirillum irakense]